MSNTTILVVDDNLIIRKILTNTLEKDGYAVVAVSSGEDALEYTRNGTVGCMILDLHMDGLSGYDVLEHLAKNGPEIPVIVLSADWQEATRKRVEELGALGFLNKPPNKNELKTAIEQALNR
ncbi:MAG: response regulator [SAR324 cluster bacterium]|nr:response regulator [SAR324 cluster bacterium]MCH8886727.1 response regulator [SAR324 cluster bacterium]